MPEKLKSLNCLLAKVSIRRPNRDDYDIYSVRELNEMDLPTNPYYKERFIEIGKKITIEGIEYKVVNISFRLNPDGWTLKQDFDIYEDPPQEANCTVLVFVEEDVD